MIKASGPENGFGNNGKIFCIKKIIKSVSVFMIISLLSACPNQPEATTPKNNKSASLKTKAVPKVTYQNEMFWDVNVDKSGKDTYLIKGKVKSSLSSFNYNVEDGHYQLLNSTAQVNKANPEWGVFKLTFKASKKDKNTTLILALFDKNIKANNKKFTLIIPLN